MLKKRTSGILLHPSSLPGRYGIGELGQEAECFIDTLVDLKQSEWQILPLGPTGYGNSPYQSLSSFAGNHLLISFDRLVEDGLLKAEECAQLPAFPNTKVDFGPVLDERIRLLKKLCAAFNDRASGALKKEFEAFQESQSWWLNDYALFIAIKQAQGLKAWIQWPRDLALRKVKALRDAGEQWADAIRHVKILQFLFQLHWQRIRSYAGERGIRLIGDIPIFVAHDSCDVWSAPDLFHLTPKGKPTVVAGVPPDYFSKTGQLWGNPLYNWEAHRETGYAWWADRLKKTLEWVDLVRIDHFRGFEAYWEVPAKEKTARNGRWVPGPGADFFKQLGDRLGSLPVIAEDLGYITQEVHALRNQFHFPGMRVLQFDVGNRDDQGQLMDPRRYPENLVIYTGTHDNDTVIGWFNELSGNGKKISPKDKHRRVILDFLGTDGSEINWDFIHLAQESTAGTSMIPLQDVMGLDSSGRMNIPGETFGNWRWRFTWPELTDETAARLVESTERFGRSRDSSS